MTRSLTLLKIITPSYADSTQLLVKFVFVKLIFSTLDWKIIQEPLPLFKSKMQSLKKTFIGNEKKIAITSVVYIH